MRKEVLIAGYGGQGIILMGVLLAHAAGYFEGKEIAQTQSYGPEARGGACRTEVIIADEPIDYIKTMNPDIFIAMSQAAFDRYWSHIDPATADVFVDETLVGRIPEEVRRLYRIPATRLAEEHCGNPLVANTVMLSAVAAFSSLVSVGALESAVAGYFGRKVKDLNLKAVAVGIGFHREEGVGRP
jgi:2-oxoglutarate ferredoxin oxidoreductase subunit gamma